MKRALSVIPAFLLLSCGGAEREAYDLTVRLDGDTPACVIVSELQQKGHSLGIATYATVSMIDVADGETVRIKGSFCKQTELRAASRASPVVVRQAAGPIVLDSRGGWRTCADPVLDISRKALAREMAERRARGPAKCAQ